MPPSIDGAKGGITLLKQTYNEFIDDDCPRLAAALAYYTIFSLPPLLVLIITLAGFFLTPDAVEAWIETQVGSLIGQQTAQQLQMMAQNAQERVQGRFSLSLVLAIVGLLFGATGAFAQMQTALNTAWDVEPDPEQSGLGLKNMFMKRVLSLGMILVIAFLLLVSLLISSILSTFSGQLGTLLPAGLSGTFVWTIDAAGSLFVISLLFATIYKVLPDAEIAWSDVWRGAFVTAILFVAGKFLIGLYIGRSTLGEVYGAAAALAILLVWVYYSAMILFLGAEFTQIWIQRRGTTIEPSEGAVKVVVEKTHVRPGTDGPAARR